MPATWSLRGGVLGLAVSGVVSNLEIEEAIGEAVKHAPSPEGLRFLWDSRGSHTPLTTEDVVWRFDLVSSLGKRGVVSRVALLVRPEQARSLEVWRLQMRSALGSLEGDAFADEAEALAWLER